jgi:photosystem II stability/assembly factor-like uncharacterized protein
MVVRSLKRQTCQKSLLGFLAPVLVVVLLSEESLSQEWVSLNTGTTNLIHDIVFVDGGRGWAVGRSGTIIHTTDGGDSWVTQTSGTTQVLHSVSFVDPMNGWAAGENATMLHTTNGGTTWAPQTGVSGQLYACHFLDASNGWATGTTGRIYRTTNGGTAWSLQHSQPNQLLFEMHFQDENTIYVAGQSGTPFPRTPYMFRTTNGGVTWTEQATGVPNGLQSVFFKDASNGWAVGWFGEMIRTTNGGETWFPQESGRTDELLFSIYFNTAASGWVVGGESGCEVFNCDTLEGEESLILRTTDGGESWNMFPNTVTNEHLVKVYFSSPDTGWIVGGAGTVLRTTTGTQGTQPLPETVTLVSPSEGLVLSTDSVQLRWNMATPDIDRYWAEYSTDSTFAISTIDSTLADTSVTINGLSDNSTYYWRVRAHNSSGYGPFSETRSFSVDIPTPSPSAVVLLLPGNAAVISSDSTELRWNTATPEIDRYWAEYSTDSLFGISTIDSTLADTSVTINGLSDNSTYYWRVRAHNSAGYGPFSETRSFSVDLPTPIPSAVALLSPNDGATVIADSTELRWNTATPDIDRYWAEYSTDSLFGISTIDSTLADTSVTINGLSDNTTYYWRVRAHNSSGYGPFSETRSFSVDLPAPLAPLLLEPADGADDLPVTLNLIWHTAPSPPANPGITPDRDISTKKVRKLASHSGVSRGTNSTSPTLVADTLSYRLQLSTESSFTAPLVDDSTLVDTLFQAGPLSNNTTYYWRVLAEGSGGESPWSETWSFSTIIALPGEITLLSPPDGSTLTTDSTALLWNMTTPDIDRYWTEYSTDSTFAISTIDSTLADTSVTINGLSDNSTYYWRVRAHNSAGYGPFSETRNFLIQTPSAGSVTRLDVGGSGYTDSEGNVFDGDQPYTVGEFGYVGGTSRQVTAGILETEDDLLYQTYRTGLFSYIFDLGDGTFLVTLYFMEPSFRVAGRRVFDVTAEGVIILDNYDIFVASGGRYTAQNETVSVTVTDGQLNLDFVYVSGPARPAISAITVETIVARGNLNVTSIPEIPDRMELGQNFPNPFNPSTHIRYSVNEGARVSLKVYDILGQEVVTLVDEWQEPGYKTVVWDAQNNSDAAVSTGMYFYRLEAGEFIETKRMIFMK